MKLLRRLFILALVLLLTGCVWLRMLEMKGQLSHFDENFRVENNGHFVLDFLHPVLYDEDYLTLAKVEPSLKESLPTGPRWKQIFHKVDAGGKTVPGVDIVFTLDFDEEKRLKRWDFSPAFIAMIPGRFLEASLRSLGKGKVDEGKKQLRVNPEDLPRLNEKPPGRAQVEAALGPPSEVSEDGGKTLSIYRFQTDTLYVKPDYEDRRFAYAKLYFDPASDELQKVTARFLGLKFSVDFRKLIKLEAIGKGEK
ncbi:hypothetical protein [Methylococcus sp. EFPC2]|uniref:hypothetical protein n=1 Tax=Methylococcus sp. EFPC2 TaxID=2812648 RepID=UPI001967C00B|nr:hypothetical protein [Methylococcus sp. EFPC2]QSA97694.1 hypothetical protein JWZ97_02325 [Methylococcus sp. EFPC2]